MRFLLLLLLIIALTSSQVYVASALPEHTSLAKKPIHNVMPKDKKVTQSPSVPVEQADKFKINLLAGGDLFVTACVTSYFVVHLKKILGNLEKTRVQYPVISPILGAILTVLIYASKSDIILKGAPSHFSEDLLLINHILRALTIIITVGSGFTLAALGAASETGMALHRIYTKFFFNNPFLTKHWFTTADHDQYKKLLYYLSLAGAAAGVTANFDAPLTGTAFALEITSRANPIIRNVTQTTAGGNKKTVVTNPNTRFWFCFISSVIAALYLRGWKFQFQPVSKHFLSNFHFDFFATSHEHNITSLVINLIQIALVAVTSGLLASSFEILRSYSNQFFKQLGGNLIYIGPLISGLMTSILTYFQRPQSIPVGNDIMKRMMNGDINSLSTIFTNLIEKMFSVPISAASGFIAGIFSPCLMIGTSFALVLRHLLLEVVKTNPTPIILNNPALYGLIGASAVLTCVFGAPWTSTILMVEQSQDYSLFLPLILTNFLALRTSKWGTLQLKKKRIIP